MKLSRKNLIVRFAFLFEKSGIPDQTDLCSLSGNIITMLFFLPMITVIGIAISPLLFIVWFTEEYFPKTKLSKNMSEKWEQGLIHQKISDFKNKTCTKIEIE